MNVRLAHAGVDDEAWVSYEYGRLLGITCDYPHAEQMLQSALKLKRQSGSQVYLVLFELALLAEHQHQPQQALKYYRELVPELDAQDVDRTHPLGVADVLRRYAKIVAATGDAAGAAQLRDRAETLTRGNPDAREEGRITPYGSACITAS